MTPHRSWLHRLGAGPKLAGLLAAGSGLLAIRAALPLLAALMVVGGLYAAARIPVRTAWRQVRPAGILLVVLFATQAAVEGWAAGAATVLRVAVLILLASLFSLTTPASALMHAVERGFQPLRRFGVRPRAVALAVSLALRFLPLLAERARLVRDAQRSRGLERSMLALAVPLIVQSLKMSHELAEAIEARGFDPADP